MGYWSTNSQGHSFIEPHIEGGDMMWGDAPADAMDDALDEIIKAFRSDLGRAPSLEELKAGLLFSAQSALDEAQQKRVTNGLYTFAVWAEWSFLNLDGEAVTTEECSYFDAHDADEARQLWDAAEEKRQALYQHIPGPSTSGKTLEEEMGMSVKFLSVEQVEPTRRELTLVGKEKK
jgi:hypothetical protein